MLLTGSMITAVCVSVSGIIGFVGLIVPHMLRLAVSSTTEAASAFVPGGRLF
jgi:iron complex transport system permease protein